MAPTLARRLAARLIDCVLLAAAGVAYGAPFDYSPVWLVVHAAVVYAYFVVCDVAWGATLGKRLLGLRVVGPSDGTVTAGAAARREAFMLLGAIPLAGPLLALVAWVAIARTGVHDRLAGGTRVVTA